MLVSLTLVALLQSAEVPATTALQGRLVNAAGQGVSDGGYTLTIRLYAEATGPQLWKQVVVGVPVAEGVFSLRLGEGADTPLAASTFETARWVGVTVEAEPELPRVPFSTEPSAFVAARAGHADTAGLAAGLACTACIQTGHLAAGAVGAAQLANGAVGAAQLANGAVGAAQLANEAVSTQHLGPDVWTALGGKLPLTGGTVTGDLTVGGTFTLGGDANFASRPIRGFRYEVASAPPVTCDAAHIGYAYYDPTRITVWVCTGTTFRSLALASLGETEQTAAVSCRAIVEAGDGGANGLYWIDLDGPGAIQPTKLLCDMTGGGWTRLASYTFEAGTEGWSSQTTTCGGLGTIMGGYGVIAGGTITRTLDLGVAEHSQLRVDLDYISIDSSDGEQGYVRLDGTTVWTQQLNNCPGGVTTQHCGNSPPCHGDTVYKVSASGAHSGPTVVIGVGSTLDQTPNDEAFGFDNLMVWFR